MKRLLLRADDLGFSEGVNYGIEKSVKEGLIRTVGIMTNMQATEHGVRLLDGENLCLGQHTNICVGRPITDAKKIPSITNEDGLFKSSKEYRNAQEDFVVLDEVVLEIEAQYNRFKELLGCEPRYFEGHAVSSENFFRGLKIVAERHGLKYLEMRFDGKPAAFGNSHLFAHMDSMLPNYDPIQSIQNIQFHEGEDEADVYICHPGYLDAEILRLSSLTTPRALEVDMLCNPQVRQWIDEQQIQMVTYDDV